MYNSGDISCMPLGFDMRFYSTNLDATTHEEQYLIQCKQDGFVENEEAQAIIGLLDVDSTVFHLKKQPLKAMMLRQLLMN